ncbi:MAG TPA: M1 family aminopeptidase [Saprospiraceae bacterium]|nr:M1 family aminopeptidase [Saprospiraceae bacterium]
MKKFLLPALLAVLLLPAACTRKAAEKATGTPVPPNEPTQFEELGKPAIGDEESPVEYTLMDGADVRPEPVKKLDTLPPYNPSHTFEHDLIHTKLELSFDWDKRRANGRATLTLRPWFYPTDRLTLDAKNFDIKSVTFEGKTEPLKYDYDNEKLVVYLGKTFTRKDEYKVVITYTAKPEERESYGGSAAITADKGLYFINADGSDPEKPRQIWTQGETESNSFWFPTIDKPNERCTQEMYLTVADSFVTLSNGLLLSQKKNPDGTRTDYWKMDKPHAPYLFMMAIGNFAVVKDKWRNIEVNYYVEPKYAPYARDIYPHTPEMLEFFSQTLGYDYPWPKFSQVIVRDYVSGAMENTTGVIFGDFMQKTSRELLDDHWLNEKVVAHEMFHHWFGDLVTCESWANLTLNEGFANYSEYLWLEHKYGRDEADSHEMQEQQGYIFSAQDGGHPLIYFGYEDRESMFDAHSYNKGGAALHMLRSYLGDDAFFAGLQRYLKKNEYTDAEAHELRLAFEDVSGQDLNWFFNQWFFGAGHPVINISYGWDEKTKKQTVTITQTQEGENVAQIFDLPLKVDLYAADGSVRRENIRMTKRTQTFTFDAPARPALVNVDADKTLLAIKDDRHTTDEWIFQYYHAPLFRDRWEALDALAEDQSAAAKKVFTDALQDKFHGIRSRAIDRADMKDPQAAALVAKLAESDPEPSVRASALSAIGQTGDKKYVPILQKALSPEQPYSVVGAGLNGLAQVDPAEAVKASKSLESDNSEATVLALAELYAQNPEASQLAWYQSKATKMDGMAAMAFFDHYGRYLTGLNDPAVMAKAVEVFKATALNPKESLWRRFTATKSIADIRNFYHEKGDKAKATELNELVKEIQAKETDATLKTYYAMFNMP